MDINLVLFKKDGSTKVFTLPGSVTVIGRRQSCDFCIPLMIVSRRHCELSQDGDQLLVRDLGSRNGTFLNGQQVSQGYINPGDSLRIGPVVFVVQINGDPHGIVSGNESIVQPPKHIREHGRTNVVTEAKEFAGLDDIGTIQDHDAAEILNSSKDAENYQQ